MDFFELVASFLGPVDNPFLSMFNLFRRGGFIILLPLGIWLAHMLWLEWVQNMYRAKKKLVLLAIDVPKANEQSMKAVEQILSTLHGVEYGPNKKEKYWIGFVQDLFVLEIVSIDGYIQYFIRCDDYNTDLVKGSVFAQYPDAEIVEVEDYVPNVPQNFPNDTHDMWGMELKLNKDDIYPIKTYEYFEDKLTGTFADPMASLLEGMSRVRPGEQIWLQIIITPQNASYRDKGIKAVENLIGKRGPQKKTILDTMVDVPVQLLNEASNQIFNTTLVATGTPLEPSQGNFLNMTTGEKIVVEEVQKKMSRLLYRTKMRFIYIAKKETFQVGRAIGPVLGAVRQFNTLDLNSIGGSIRTGTFRPVYYLVKTRQAMRKNNLMFGYRTRNPRIGENMFIMSTAEIATIFHFPMMSVRAPLVAKTESKKSEPPFRLPVERVLSATPEPEVSLPIPTAAPAVSGPVRRPPPPPPPAPPAGWTPPGSTPTEAPVPHQLHSMPGLPPGVKPVAHPTETQSAYVPYGRDDDDPRGKPLPAAPQPPSAGPTPTPTPELPVQAPSAPAAPSTTTKPGTPPADLPFA